MKERNAEQEQMERDARLVAQKAKALDWELVEERLSPYVIDMTQEMPDIEPLISIDGCCVCSRGNLTAICGEAKSKKTFLTTALVASAMAIPYKRLNNFKNVDKNMSINVLWADTEQGEVHVRKVVDRIAEMTGAKLGGLKAEPRLTMLKLRELSPMERFGIIHDAIYHNLRVNPYDIVVIDGVADLQRNTNNLEESDALVDTLMKLSTQTNTHIICVLHTNPGTDKARGHLGSSLQRKCESVIYVHRAGDCTIVEPQYCRNEPFERFAFTISESGIPELCDVPTAVESQTLNDKIISLLNSDYGGCVERNTLSNKVSTLYNINLNTARMRVRRLIDKGELYADGNLVSSAPTGQLTTLRGTTSRAKSNEPSGEGATPRATSSGTTGEDDKQWATSSGTICEGTASGNETIGATSSGDAETQKHKNTKTHTHGGVHDVFGVHDVSGENRESGVSGVGASGVGASASGGSVGSSGASYASSSSVGASGVSGAGSSYAGCGYGYDDTDDCPF
jgi:hypothetical protein